MTTQSFIKKIYFRIRDNVCMRECKVKYTSIIFVWTWIKVTGGKKAKSRINNLFYSLFSFCNVKALFRILKNKQNLNSIKNTNCK